MAWLLDLDGVVWLAHEPIPGASEAVGRLQAAGETVMFVTNFSALTEAEAEQKLADVGIDATGAVVSSSMAAGSLIGAGERVLVCGGPGVAEAVERAGATVLRPVETDGLDDTIDAVVVGFHRDFDFHAMAVAAHALHRGARLIATNTDPTYPTPDRLLPGNGALVAAIATAGKVEPIVAGKPHQPVADLIQRRLDTVDGGGGLANHVMVGDLPATDGRLARLLGIEFAFVASGVTTLEQALAGDPAPDVVAADLRELVDQRMGPS